MLLKGKLALIGVGARCETHPDGTKTLVFGVTNEGVDLEVIVPFSEDGADSVGRMLLSEKKVIVPEPGTKVPRAD
jgi:hypothetical protein